MTPTRWLAAGLMVLGAVAAGGLWYVFFRPAGPAPVALSSAAPSATIGPVSSAASGSPAAGVDGTWSIDASAGSFVGYRVQETLAGIGGNIAVGRTTEVTGSLAISGTTVSSVEITAVLTGLTSDDDRRDGQLRQRGLETSQFPTATFKLTQPIDLGSIPAAGETIDVTATGELTLHGVTKTVELPLQARLTGGAIEVVGSIEIQFADYDIIAPTSFIALSVEDHGTMELDLTFTRS
jgi:polyisoprenoid-binding protein YceI